MILTSSTVYVRIGLQNEETEVIHVRVTAQKNAFSLARHF